MLVEEYAHVVVSSVYYFVFHMYRTRPTASLSWLQRIAFQKAKAFLNSIGRVGVLTVEGGTVGMSEAVFAGLSRVVNKSANAENKENRLIGERQIPIPVGMPEGSEEIFQKFSNPDAQKCVSIIFDYEKELARSLDNKCMIKPIIPSAGGEVSWAAVTGTNTVLYPDPTAENIFNKYFPSSAKLSTIENGYYNWHTVCRPLHFFWRNTLVPAHEVIHRHHNPTQTDKNYTGRRVGDTFPRYNESEDIHAEPCPFSFPPVEGMPVPMPPGPFGVMAEDHSVSYDLTPFKDETIAMYCGTEGLPAVVTFTHEQMFYFRKSAECGKPVPYTDGSEGTLNQVTTTDARVTPTEYLAATPIPNHPQGGGAFAYGPTYATELVASAGNLNVFLNSVKNYCSAEAEKSKKLLFQCHAIFGMLYVVELLRIIDANIRRKSNECSPRRGRLPDVTKFESQQLIKNYTHFSRLRESDSRQIRGASAGRETLYRGISETDYLYLINAIMSGNPGSLPWEMTYAKHFVALEFAGDFFNDHNTVGNYFNPTFWSNIQNEWVLGYDQWLAVGEAPPNGLVVASWITEEFPSAQGVARAPAPAGGARFYSRRARRTQRRGLKKRSRATRRR